MATTTIEQTLTTVIRDALNAGTRPVPAGVPIRAQMDKEPVERPFVVVLADGGESLHPTVRRLRLVLRVRSQIDATPAALAGEYLAATAAAMVARGAAIKTALGTAGLRVLVWMPADFGDEGEDARGRFQDMGWQVTLARAV